jgi:hypothetical protein
LSAGVKQLEEQMGVMLVNRGSRFQGFTPEGWKRFDEMRGLSWRSCAHKSNHRHGHLLRLRRERPRGRRSAEKANELTSPHIRTQAQGHHRLRLLTFPMRTIPLTRH